MKDKFDDASKPSSFCIGMKSSLSLLTGIYVLMNFSSKLAHVRSFIKDKGYDTSRIDEVLHAVAKDPEGRVSQWQETVSTSTIKEDAANEQSQFQAGLAQGSTADLQAMSCSTAHMSQMDSSISSNRLRVQESCRQDEVPEGNVQTLPSREAMPPPSMPRYDHRSPISAETPRLQRSENYLSASLPAMSTPARFKRPSHKFMTSYTPRTSSRHFTSSDEYTQRPIVRPIAKPNFDGTTTPQKRRQSRLSLEPPSIAVRTPNRIRCGQESVNDRGDSAFEMMNSPYRRPILGLYADQSSNDGNRNIDYSMSSAKRSELPRQGVIKEYTRDSSTPRAIRPSAQSPYSTTHRDILHSKQLREGSGHESPKGRIDTSPSTLRPTSFVNSLQSFAFHGDPVSTYMEQRSLGMLGP